MNLPSMPDLKLAMSQDWERAKAFWVRIKSHTYLAPALLILGLLGLGWFTIHSLNVHDGHRVTPGVIVAKPATIPTCMPAPVVEKLVPVKPAAKKPAKPVKKQAKKPAKKAAKSRHQDPDWYYRNTARVR